MNAHHAELLPDIMVVEEELEAQERDNGASSR